MRTLAALLGSAGLAALALAFVPNGAEAQTSKHDCSYCHNLHGGGFGALTVRDVQADLCGWCHDPDGGQGATINGKTIPKQGRGANPLSGFADHVGVRSSDSWQPSCWDCHNHEGEADSTTTSYWKNLKMVPATINDPFYGKRPVIFTQWSGDSSFADSNADSAFVGVCETCHTEAQRHRNYANFTSGRPANERRHNAAADCTQCHTHNTGFQGLGGGCAGCHNSVKGTRRATTPEFERQSHHLNLAGLGVATAQDIADATCQVCHAENVGGTMGDGNLQFNDQSGGVITLTADPHTDRTAARNLSALCLGCHKDTPPTDPFGDGQNPPARNVAAWNASSHASNISESLGCIDCHSSGHGSEKVRLLGNEINLSGGFQSPAAYGPGAAPSSTFLNEEQEGFCLNCHAAGGLSTYNIAAGFSQPIRWVPEVTGTTGNPDFNDRHDIQQDAQTRSGVGGFECTTCHNAHTATSTQPFVSNPDPTDGRTPGVGSLWNTTINGVNYQNSLVTAFCLDCHDNSFPAGLTGAGAAGHTITNIDSTWRYLYTAKRDESKNDRMGIFNSAGGEGINDPILLWNGSQYSSIARPWVTGAVFNCEQCHSPHPGAKRNLFSLKDEVQHNGQTIVWTNGGADTVRNYSVTSWAVTDGVNNSGFFCNSCHDRDAMNSKAYCYNSCHIHGGSPGI